MMDGNPPRPKVTSQEQLLRILREELPVLRQRYGVRRMAVYGSFVHGHPGPRSDVDLLVDLERPLGLDFVALVYHLEDRVGRSVEVATFETLERRRRHPRYRRLARAVERTMVDVEPAPG
jgi:predicted nucleotidyltransferase